MSTNMRMRSMSHARVSKAVTTLQAVFIIVLISVGAVGGYLWYSSSRARRAELEIFARFEAELEDLRQKMKIPAFSAAIVKDQELIWAKGFGYADLENEVEATPDTPYRLASVTKPFAATIIMQLVEEGKLDLEDPISKYDIDIESPGIVRVKHLLTHTSEGIPGSHYRYRGDRYALLSEVIRRASGKSFLELLIERILEPLDMTNTAPSIIEVSELDRDFTNVYEKLAKPYRLDSTYEIMESEYPKHFSAAAGLISTVVDMAKFDIAIDQNDLVHQDAKEQMFAPTVSTTGAELPYGLGWFTQRYKGNRMIWHYGYWNCISSLILKVPDENLTFIILANADMLSRPYSLGDGDVLTSTLALALLKTFIFEPQYGQDVPDIDWEADIDDLTDQLKQITDKELREIMERELLSHLRLYFSVGDWEITSRLLKVQKQVYPLARESYSKYGFSFDYPVGMSISEGGFMEESASETSGVVTFMFDPFEVIGVIWNTAESAPELETVLDELFELVEGQGAEVNDRGPLVTHMKDDHEMVYQRANITENGLPTTGVASSWYCDEANRVYIFYFTTLPEFATQQDLLTEFQRHLDSLVCH